MCVARSVHLGACAFYRVKINSAARCVGAPFCVRMLALNKAGRRRSGGRGEGGAMIYVSIAKSSICIHIHVEGLWDLGGGGECTRADSPDPQDSAQAGRILPGHEDSGAQAWGRVGTFGVNIAVLEHCLS